MTDRELMQKALGIMEWISGLESTPLVVKSEFLNALRARLAQPEPEPVACDCDSPAWCKQYKKCHRAMLGFEPYVAPPQREWQGLTDEEIVEVWKNASGYDLDFARAIEAKLKEKNT